MAPHDSHPAAIVTGGGRNLGRTIALRLARDGFDVAVWGPNADNLESTAADIRALGRRALALATDIADEKQVDQAAERTRQAFARIDVLVNNAAIVGPHAPVAKVTLADWNEVLAINLTGAFLCARAVIPLMMQQRGGRIINISSIAGKMAYALRSPYAVSKWGLHGLTLTLAKELGDYDIQVNAICPGPVEGPRMRGIIETRARELGKTIEEMERIISDTTVLKRFVNPEDVAAMVALLASSAGKSITGQTLDVTCGYGL